MGKKPPASPGGFLEELVSRGAKKCAKSAPSSRDVGMTAIDIRHVTFNPTYQS